LFICWETFGAFCALFSSLLTNKDEDVVDDDGGDDDDVRHRRSVAVCRTR